MIRRQRSGAGLPDQIGLLSRLATAVGVAGLVETANAAAAAKGGKGFVAVVVVAAVIAPVVVGHRVVGFLAVEGGVGGVGVHDGAAGRHGCGD